MQGFGIGIDQQLVRVEAVASLGFIRTVDAIAVQLPGPDFREEYVPYLIGPLLYPDVMSFFFLVWAVKQTKFHSGGVFREQGEVDTFTVPCRA
jgi:hypothetical protein